MIDVKQKKDKIVSFLEMSGPSIPVRISKAIEMEPVFTSAILSELLSEKRIKISNMRIGASPFYFLPGQEQRLEEHIENLKAVERNAFLKLKENKVVFDEEEEPAVRVALRNIRDFAAPFKFKDKIFWKYAFASEEEVEKALNLFDKSKKNLKISKTRKIKEGGAGKAIKSANIQGSRRKYSDKKEKGEKSLVSIFDRKSEKSDFFLEVERFLKSKGIEIMEEIQSDKKEVVARIKMSTSLGEMYVLLIAKNKKTVNKDEINSALQRVKYHNLPCIYLIRSEPKKNILKYIEANGLIKIGLIPRVL